MKLFIWRIKMDFNDKKVLNITLLFFGLLFYVCSFIVPNENHKFYFILAGMTVNFFQMILIITQTKH